MGCSEPRGASAPFPHSRFRDPQRAEVSTCGPSTRCSLNEALMGGPSQDTEHQEWACVTVPLPCFEGTLGRCHAHLPGLQVSRQPGL